MKALFQAAFDLQSFILEREWRHAFIGGLALQRWGEERSVRMIGKIMARLNNSDTK
jgi:hypothetical protein